MVKIFKLIENNLKIPVQYGKNTERIKPPFLIYLGDGSLNLTADNKIYNSKNRYVLELYFDKKNESLEKNIESIFNENKIIWEKTEDIYIASEELYEIIYYL